MRKSYFQILLRYHKIQALCLGESPCVSNTRYTVFLTENDVVYDTALFCPLLMGHPLYIGSWGAESDPVHFSPIASDLKVSSFELQTRRDHNERMSDLDVVTVKTFMKVVVDSLHWSLI